MNNTHTSSAEHIDFYDENSGDLYMRAYSVQLTYLEDGRVRFRSEKAEVTTVNLNTVGVYTPKLYFRHHNSQVNVTDVGFKSALSGGFNVEHRPDVVLLEEFRGEGLCKI